MSCLWKQFLYEMLHQKTLGKKPYVAWAVLQTASKLIKVSDGLWIYVPNTVNPQPEERGR